MIPLTIRQTSQMKKLQSIQPKMKAIQEKYKGKSGDAEEKCHLRQWVFTRNWVSPIGCLGPMIIQMPLWIGLYRAIVQTMPSTPEEWQNYHLFYSWNPYFSSSF